MNMQADSPILTICLTSTQPSVSAILDSPLCVRYFQAMSFNSRKITLPSLLRLPHGTHTYHEMYDEGRILSGCPENIHNHMMGRFSPHRARNTTQTPLNIFQYTSGALCRPSLSCKMVSFSPPLRQLVIQSSKPSLASKRLPDSGKMV